jgi:hypothetical protein
MFALFTLWTDIKMLKHPEETFKQAFDNFMIGGDGVICKIEQAMDNFFVDTDEGICITINNIQYWYECSDCANLKRKSQEGDVIC